jgi:suppressor of G2 allele of SKP1
LCGAKKIELKIKKKLENINWIGLESGSATTLLEKMQNNVVPAYPSSSKVKRDFNAIDKELDKMLSKEGGEGDSALNGLFKQIYERSDENTKRAMIKSYQTSGGTVLSTNW